MEKIIITVYRDGSWVRQKHLLDAYYASQEDDWLVNIEIG